MFKKCILDDEKSCIECGECSRCDMDPDKICDNCGKCIETDADFAAIEIAEVDV